MIIKTIEIDGFGKFSKASFGVQKGFNLILGNNEDGKTTLMSFVKMMFYSSSSKTEKATDLFKSLRKKYRPWDGSLMQGAIEFEFDGMDFRIQKEFLKSEVSDKTTIFCKTTGENIQIENKNEAGEYFFGMKLDEFERSVFIGQSGGFAADSSSDSLAMRISNLSVSGDENISHELILKRLHEASEELVSKSGKKGILADERKVLEELQFEEQRLLRLEEEQSSVEIEISKLKSEILSLEEELQSLSNEQRINSAKKDLNAFYALHNKHNLLNAVKNQLASYNTPEKYLREYIKNAKLLNNKIDNTLTLIQEITTNQAATTVSDEEYAELSQLHEKTIKLQDDIKHIEGRIAALNDDLKSKFSFLTTKTRLLALIPLIAGLLSATILAVSQFWAFVTPVFGIGVSLSVILFCLAKKCAASRLSVRLLKRDIENEIRELSCFSEEMLSKSPTEIAKEANLQFSMTVSVLSEGLAKYHCSNISELRAKSVIACAEDLQAITKRLAAEKENFISLARTIKPVETYSAAKIMYIELCESISSFDSLSGEIDTLCKATGISDTSPSFVDNKIKELGEFIQNAPIYNREQRLSSEDLQKVIKNKRAMLEELQNKIVVPEKNLSEVRRAIESSKNKCNNWEKRLKEISIAIELMDEAILDANKGLGSRLSERVGKYLFQISGEKYDDVLVPRDLNVEIRSSKAEGYHEWKYMSQGAIDRIYLALRMAITDIIVQGKAPLPLFFDDILSQYDDAGCKQALIFLKDYLDNSGAASQIIFLTCHNHIAEIAKDIFYNLNEIKLQ